MNENNLDVRWLQRLTNYEKALDNLSDAVTLAQERELSKLEKQGVIKNFEIAQELCWNTLKDFLEIDGEKGIYGSRDTFQLAFDSDLIKSGKKLLESIQSKSLAAHSYNEETADDIFTKIVEHYCDAFEEVRVVMQKERIKRKA